jgi:hypothetical protein
LQQSVPWAFHRGSAAVGGEKQNKKHLCILCGREKNLLSGDINFSKKARAGMCQSAFMLAFFTVFWAAFLFWGFGINAFSIIGCIFFVGIAIAIFCGAVKANRVVSSLPDSAVNPKDKRIARYWNIVFSSQGLAIGVICAILGILGQYQYIVPSVVFIVGIHYFPLGAIYHTAIHFVVGAFVVLIALLSIALQAFGTLGIEAVGICALVATISTAILGVYILRLIKQ